MHKYGSHSNELIITRNSLLQFFFCGFLKFADSNLSLFDTKIDHRFAFQDTNLYTEESLIVIIITTFKMLGSLFLVLQSIARYIYTR